MGEIVTDRTDSTDVKIGSLTCITCVCVCVCVCVCACVRARVHTLKKKMLFVQCSSRKRAIVYLTYENGLILIIMKIVKRLPCGSKR